MPAARLSDWASSLHWGLVVRFRVGAHARLWAWCPVGREGVQAAADGRLSGRPGFLHPLALGGGAVWLQEPTGARWPESPPRWARGRQAPRTRVANKRMETSGR